MTFLLGKGGAAPERPDERPAKYGRRPLAFLLNTKQNGSLLRASIFPGSLLGHVHIWPVEGGQCFAGAVRIPHSRSRCHKAHGIDPRHVCFSLHLFLSSLRCWTPIHEKCEGGMPCDFLQTGLPIFLY